MNLRNTLKISPGAGVVLVILAGIASVGCDEPLFSRKDKTNDVGITLDEACGDLDGEEGLVKEQITLKRGEEFNIRNSQFKAVGSGNLRIIADVTGDGDPEIVTSVGPLLVREGDKDYKVEVTNYSESRTEIEVTTGCNKER